MRPHMVDLWSFTAGIAGAPDLAVAKSMSEYLGTQHYELVYTENDVERALPEVIRYLESFDAPLIRSAIPMYFLSTLAHDYVKVVLTGEGADELFAGYDYLRRYEKDDEFQQELAAIVARLQDTNLQRADRVTMRHGLEARVPFLDLDLVRFAMRLPAALKRPQPNKPEKWLLREACKGLLPFSVLNRKKLKFSEGAGSAEVMVRRIQKKISPEEFERERRVAPDLVLRSPEELYYYRIWRDVMGTDVPPALVGRTGDRTAAAA
jgi:asparagine synthase (glutamine-hydrolysing)